MRIALTTILFAISATACVQPDGAADETDNLIDEDIAPGMTEFEMPASVEPLAAHRLMSTPFNLDILRGCHTNFHLDWSCPSHEDGSHAHFPFKREVPVNDVEVADNHNGFWGECVSLVKAASGSDVVTANWHKGANVFAGLTPGTAIATFFASGGHYEGHAAIFLAYIKDSGGHTIGIRVADQNWGERVVKRHMIRKGGSGVSNADNFYAIVVD